MMGKKPIVRTPIRSRYYKWFLAMIALAISFLLLEAGVRLIFAYQVGPRVLLYGTSYYKNAIAEDANKKTGEKDTNNKVGTEFGKYKKYFPNEYKVDVNPKTGESFQVGINSYGFRGENFTYEKEANEVRIVTLGASSTFGYFDRDDETYPHYLEQRLNKQAGGESSFKVINLGIPHLTSDEILALFQAEALLLSPDVVTFYEGINDSSQMLDKVWQEKKTEAPQTTFSKLRQMAANVSVFRGVYGMARDRFVSISMMDTLLLSGSMIKYNKNDFENHVLGKSERFLDNVARIREICEEKGIVFIVMSQQARSKMTDDVKGLTYQQEVQLVREKLEETDGITHQEKTFLTHNILSADLKSWAHSQGVPFVDIIQLLDQDRDVLLSWVHLSPRGNRLIAEALAGEICRQLTSNKPIC